jgi:hypothetical protein
MRLMMLLLAVITGAAACSAAAYSGPILSDAERCARFGGSWYDNQCRAGGM